MSRASDFFKEFWPWLFFSIGIIFALFGATNNQFLFTVIGAILVILGGGYLWVMAMIIEPRRAKTALFTVSKMHKIECPDCGRITEGGSFCKYCGARLEQEEI